MKRDSEAYKALKTDLLKLQPGQFAEFSPKLQLMLMVRMIYENPENMQALSGLDITLQPILLEAAQMYILKNDPALEQARRSRSELQEVLGQLTDDPTEVQKNWIKSVKMTKLFGSEGAQILYNFCESASVLSDQVDRHEQAMLNPSPGKPKLPSTASVLSYSAHLVTALHMLPKDFCSDAKAARDKIRQVE